MHHYFPLASKALLRRLLYYLIVLNSCIQYSCFWKTVLQIETLLSNVLHLSYTALAQLWLQKPETDQLMEQFVLTQLLTLCIYQFCCIYKPSLWDVKSCSLQTWTRVKAEARQQKGKREAKPKKHYSPKRAVNFLLCAFIRDKIGKREVEWRNTQRKRTAEESSCIPLPQHHLSTQPTAPPESWGYTPLAVHRDKQEHHQANLLHMSAYKWLSFSSDRVWLAYSDIKNSVQMSELN